jgi:RIO kinase 1
MNLNDYYELFDDLDTNEQLNNYIEKDKRRERFPTKHFKHVREENAEFIGAQDDSRKNFKFTYQAARFEEWWLLDSLGEFYEHQWISDVLKRVKGGKEASVYQCAPGAEVQAEYVAAKVYRPRSLRNLKNDSQYRVGRIELDADGHRVKGDRAYKAIKKRTEYGEEIRHQSWIAYEFQTLQQLFEAGADVPRPYAMEKNAILMDFIGDADNAAPPLSSVRLGSHEAKTLFERVMTNLRIMLAHERIHGDLSAYNILYWDGTISLIDFPQVVASESNPQAWGIFLRDVTRICDYFTSQGVKAHARKLAEEMWQEYGHKVVKEVDPVYLDAEKPEDRKLWAKQNK